MAAKISPRFCKIILCDNIRIPKKFTQRYGQILPDTVFLKVPGGGALWEVELVRNDDGEIWLEEKGWKEFKDHYHIGFGHYLVFKFDTEFSHFKVCIFDMESVEIDYPVDHSIDDSVVFLGRFSESQKDKEKIVEHCSPEEMTCRKRPNADDLLGNPVRKSARKMDLGGDYHTENTDINGDSFTRQGRGSSIGTRTFRFTKELKTCNAYILPLPTEFARGTGISRMRMRTGRKVVLQNKHGKKWLVKLNVAGRTRGSYSLGGGWNKFRTDNKMTFGDTLSFTFVSDNIIEARVVKMVPNKEFKRRKVSNDINRAGRTHKFSVEMVKRHMDRLRFPQDFVRGMPIPAFGKVMLKDGKGREWSVRVVKDRAGHHVWMTTGWNDFLKSNGVCQGDVVSFKFIPNSGNVIESQVQKRRRRFGKPLFANKGRGRPPAS